MTEINDEVINTRDFYIGFRKAIYEIYYNMSKGEQALFKVVLCEKILKDNDLVYTYTEVPDNKQPCQPGQCPDGNGGCVPCVFPS